MTKPKPPSPDSLDWLACWAGKHLDPVETAQLSLTAWREVSNFDPARFATIVKRTRNLIAETMKAPTISASDEAV